MDDKPKFVIHSLALPQSSILGGGYDFSEKRRDRCPPQR